MNSNHQTILVILFIFITEYSNVIVVVVIKVGLSVILFYIKLSV